MRAALGMRTALASVSPRLSALSRTIHARSSIATTVPNEETAPELVKPFAPPSLPAQRLNSSRSGASGGPQEKRKPPELVPIKARNTTQEQLAKGYRKRLEIGKPWLIRNLPGFLEGQSWFEHRNVASGTFEAPKSSPKAMENLSFALLKELLANAAPGLITKVSETNVTAAEFLGTAFDSFVAVCKISRETLIGDVPPLLRFRDWLKQSDQFKNQSDSLNKIITGILRTYYDQPRQLTPFKAPLALIRAAHLYNHEMSRATRSPRSAKGPSIHETYTPNYISGLGGLVVLEDELTDEFPFPRVVRDIGQTTYQTKSCSIRAGIRPHRSDIRRYRASTVVVGQLAGYSVVTLIPPRLKALQGLPLDFHERVPKLSYDEARRWPMGKAGLSLSGKAWTRDFEDELVKSGDVVVATLVPGDGLLVPEGWWFGVRSINNDLQLHATVTWFLSRADRDDAEYEKSDGEDYFTPGKPPVVEI
ncbi:hypothetical protein F5Y15DRAFT_373115 [Xylariaceae sp. FL0016]|nr:hypothetical protein F5Y15DRAFT_373115 [Xylariaceae sp. FL0016]